MEKVIIFGIGDISQIAYLYLSENKNYEIVAFTIDKEYIKEDTFLGLPVVAFENLEEKFSQNEYKLFIPLSYTKINKLREQKFLEAKEKGYVETEFKRRRYRILQTFNKKPIFPGCQTVCNTQ